MASLERIYGALSEEQQFLAAGRSDAGDILRSAYKGPRRRGKTAPRQGEGAFSKAAVEIAAAWTPETEAFAVHLGNLGLGFGNACVRPRRYQAEYEFHQKRDVFSKTITHSHFDASFSWTMPVDTDFLCSYAAGRRSSLPRVSQSSGGPALWHTPPGLCRTFQTADGFLLFSLYHGKKGRTRAEICLYEIFVQKYRTIEGGFTGLPLANRRKVQYTIL